MPRDWFMAFSYGSNANGGTSWSDALKDITAAGLAAFAAGDRLIIDDTAGAIRPLSDLSNFNSFRWSKSNCPGSRFFIPRHGNRPMIRGDVEVSLTWVNVGGDQWRANLPVNGLQIEAVTVAYDASTFTRIGETWNYGVLGPGNPATTAWTWAKTAGAPDTLDVNTPGIDPNAVPITIAKGEATTSTDGNLLEFSNCPGSYFGPIETRLSHCLNTSTGAGLLTNSCYGSVFDGCKLLDHGLHNLELLASGSRTDGCRVIGLVSGGSVSSVAPIRHGTPFVCYSDGQDIYDVRIASPKIGVYNHLTPLQANFNSVSAAPASCTGIFWHADGNNLRVRDIECRDARVFCINDGNTTNGSFGGGNLKVFGGGFYQGEGRPARIINPQTWDDHSLSLNGHWLFRGGKMRFLKLGSSYPGTGGINMVTLTCSAYGGAGRCNPLFEGIELVVNLDADTGPSPMYGFRCGANNGNADGSEGVTCRGITLIDVGVNTQAKRLFDWNGNKTNFFVRCTGSRLGFASATNSASHKLCGSDGTVAVGQKLFRGNHYLGFHTTQTNVFSGNTAHDSKTEWLSLVENGVGNEAPKFTDTDGSAFFVAGSLVGDGSGTPAAGNSRGEKVSPRLLPRYGSRRDPCLVANYGALQTSSLNQRRRKRR